MYCVGNNEETKLSPTILCSRVKCVACRVISHEGCISTLNDRFPCKETFREGVRTYREQTVILHHWVIR